MHMHLNSTNKRLKFMREVNGPENEITGIMREYLEPATGTLYRVDNFTKRYQVRRRGEKGFSPLRHLPPPSFIDLRGPQAQR